jgi:spore coat polysaccharide biosynthesis protein SpsF
MTIVAFIACRMGSSRLPGKSLMPVLGQPMIERMVERVRRSRRIDHIVLATSTLDEDTPIADLADALHVGCFRGSPDDVLLRMRDAVRANAPDVVVELLGDNPLVHAELIDEVIKYREEQDLEYATTATVEYPFAPHDLPKFMLGIRVQAFLPSALERCAALAREPYYRENSTAYIADHPELFRSGFIGATGRWAPLSRPTLNVAVNLPKNLELIRALFERCHPGNPDFSITDALRTFDSDPSLQVLAGS